jgi:microsomal dipeptidase-like Zn-dependent dipeptidase
VYDYVYIFTEVIMSTAKQWENKVKGLLKAELKRRNISYQELVDKLAALGVTETPENIANKISRGKFTAVFLVQCLEAIGCQTVRLGE